jgi:hypothetical protein
MYHVAQVVHHVPAQYIFYGILRRYVPRGPGSTPFSCGVHLLWDSAQICTAWLRSTSLLGFCADIYHVAQVVHHFPAQYIFYGILRRYVLRGPGSTPCSCAVRTSIMGFCADMYHVAQVAHHVPTQYIFNGVLRRYVPRGPGSTSCSCAVHLLWGLAQICTAWPRKYTIFLRSTSFIYIYLFTARGPKGFYNFFY